MKESVCMALYDTYNPLKNISKPPIKIKGKGYTMPRHFTPSISEIETKVEKEIKQDLSDIIKYIWENNIKL